MFIHTLMVAYLVIHRKCFHRISIFLAFFRLLFIIDNYWTKVRILLLLLPRIQVLLSRTLRLLVLLLVLLKYLSLIRHIELHIIHLLRILHILHYYLLLLDLLQLTILINTLNQLLRILVLNTPTSFQ